MPFFVSLKTGERFYHRVTYSKVEGGETIHQDEKRQQLLCPVSGEPLVLESSKIKEMLEANTAPGYNEFAGMSPERKKEMLQQRADQNFKREIAPRKEQMLKDAYNGKY